VTDVSMQPKASRWSWSRRWSASPPNQYGQISSRLLWKGWNEILSQAGKSLVSQVLKLFDSIVELTRDDSWRPVINLDKLGSLVPVEQREKYLKDKKTSTAPVLDLLSFGYSKVLGKGRLPEGA
jgi:ribosomal protein L15